MEDWQTGKFGKIPLGSEPKFILFLVNSYFTLFNLMKRGKIVDVIIGANTPKLKASVGALCPLEI